MTVPVHPVSRAVADGFGGERGGAAGRVRVPAAQPGRGDHRRAQRGADRGGQRVQPADQQALALDLGVPERGALLAVPVDPFLHRVDIHEGQRVLAGQQRRPAGQLAQQLAVHRLQLADVSPGVGPQVRSQRRRRPDPAEQAAIAPCRSRSMSSMLSAPAAMPATRHPTFRCALTPHGPPGGTCPRPARPGRPAAPAPSPGPGRPATRDSGHRTRRASSPEHATIALTRCPLEPGAGSFRHSHRPSSEGTFLIDTPRSSPIRAVDRGLAREPASIAYRRTTRVNLSFRWHISISNPHFGARIGPW